MPKTPISPISKTPLSSIGKTTKSNNLPAGPGTTTRAPVTPSNVWQNGGGHFLTATTGPQSLRKRTMINAATNSIAGPRQPPPPRSGVGMANLTSRVERIQINPGNNAVYNPSIGPSPSTMSTNWRQGQIGNSQVSATSSRQVVNSQVCKLSGFTRRNFRLGDVIAIPFHTPNSNPNVAPDDRRLTLTCEGPAYSKRRMVVVLWIYQRDMFCLPLYTFQNTGLRNKQGDILKEYVSMKNVDAEGFQAQGKYPPVEVRCDRKPMDDDTTVHITGGIKVGCNEDISKVGRLTETSHKELVNLWRLLAEDAQREKW